MTRARWNWVRIRSVLIVALALWHLFQGTGVGSAKAVAFLALAMAWYAIDELEAQREDSRTGASR